jgi:prepilin-type N-terminal cleavage/methylation domain-containing protein
MKIKHPSHRTRSANQGFTLIELMVVVAIIGLLAALSAQSYDTYVRRARSVEAHQNLSIFAQAQIVYHQNENQFVTVATPSWSRVYPDGRYRNIVDTNTEILWGLLGEPFPGSIEYRYMYAGASGGTDGAGSPLVVRPAPGNIVGNKQLMEPGSYDGNNYAIVQTQSGEDCGFTFDYAGFGIGQQPNERWTLMLAVADLKLTDPNLCTVYLKVLRVKDGTVAMSPAIDLYGDN